MSKEILTKSTIKQCLTTLAGFIEKSQEEAMDIIKKGSLIQKAHEEGCKNFLWLSTQEGVLAADDRIDFETKDFSDEHLFGENIRETINLFRSIFKK